MTFKGNQQKGYSLTSGSYSWLNINNYGEVYKALNEIDRGNENFDVDNLDETVKTVLSGNQVGGEAGLADDTK